ncbi:MAG: CAP domain-containing protein [Candidatus Levyibacteriota bacterium]
MQKGRILLFFLLVSTSLILLSTLLTKMYYTSKLAMGAGRTYLTQNAQVASALPSIALAKEGDPSATPTPFPTPTSIPILIPTSLPTPTPTRIPLTPTLPAEVLTKAGPTATPAPIPPRSGGGLSDLLSQINDYRKSQGLSPVSSNAEICSFAKIRAGEIAGSFNHDGFTNRINSHTLPYSSYSSITENIAMNSNEGDVVKEWINSSGHAENMRKDTPFVCVEKSGNYYAYEGLKP